MIAAFVAAALVAPQSIDACAARLLPYAGWTETLDTRWSLSLPAPGGGALSYLGAEHSRDPAHPQFAAIDQAFAAAAPTVVFYEGPDRGVAETAQATIESRGESGYVRFLAARAGAETRPLEPGPIDQLKAISAAFSPEQAFLFFIGREAARLRERESLTGEPLDRAVDSLVGRAAALAEAEGLAPPFRDLAGLDAAWDRWFPEGPSWRAAPGDWYDPNASDAETGGRFMAAVNAASSEFRDRHMYRLLAAAALAGERVFAVVGRNHVPMQAPALRCALGG